MVAGSSMTVRHDPCFFGVTTVVLYEYLLLYHFSVANVCIAYSLEMCDGQYRVA
jgi:hypothetical protein